MIVNIVRYSIDLLFYNVMGKEKKKSTPSERSIEAYTRELFTSVTACIIYLHYPVSCTSAWLSL